jgi:Fe-S oxidoreductase/nitrate reductase gamma subunit
VFGSVLAVAGETREVFQGLGVVGKSTFYLLALATILVFAWGCVRRVRKYRQGRPAGRSDRRRLWGRSAVDALYLLASNRTVRRRDHSAGTAHLLVFWGFITLFIGTVILTIDYDVVRHATRLVGGEERSFFQGAFYVGYSLVLDTMGLAAVGGLAYLIWRRAAGRRALDYTRADRPEGGYDRRRFVQGDWLFLGLLLAVLVTGFVHEGLRIRAAGFPDFEVWSVVGWVLARGVRAAGIGAATAEDLRLAGWWVHVLPSLGFVAYIPWSKAMHMLTDTANLVAAEPGAARALAAPASADRLGYRELADFTWKQLLDLDSCTKCGRCHVACPATASGAPLSPRDLILDLRQWAELGSGGRTLLDHERRAAASGPLAGANGHEHPVRIAGDVIPAETLWACTTCMACIEACPVGIEHVPTIVELRRSLVDEGAMEPGLQSALQNISQQGNSFGKSGRMRARWTRGLDVRVKDARKEPVEHLWFVGDFASFDERLQELSRALARILTRAGVDFGILYEDERNAGNDVRRVGEEGLFEMLVEQNLAAFAKADFREVFTTDPHSFNTLRNEYPAHGFDRPVKHYTELLADLLEAGVLEVHPLGARVTYHDPCYLARYNRQTDAPRRVLAALGCELVEMPRNRDNTFCCGAGGGRIWMDDAGTAERPSESRIREAAALDVDRFVVACPKDFTMYTDAAKTTGHDDRLRVVDVVQLVEEALVPAPLAVVD